MAQLVSRRGRPAGSETSDPSQPMESTTTWSVRLMDLCDVEARDLISPLAAGRPDLTGRS